jgi:hypothetical protein
MGQSGVFSLHLIKTRILNRRKDLRQFVLFHQEIIGMAWGLLGIIVPRKMAKDDNHAVFCHSVPQRNLFEYTPKEAVVKDNFGYVLQWPV